MPRKIIKKTSNYVRFDIWRIRLDELPAKKSFLIRQLRIIILTIRGFDQDKCQLRASALTFYTLLSIVPVLAMAFGIAKGFGYDKVLEEQIIGNFAGQEAVFGRAIEFARSMLENTKGGMMAGLGVLVLFWAVLKILGNIELSFNEIWEIEKGRKVWRKFSDYFAIILICPLLLILSGSATVFLTAQVVSLSERFEWMGYISNFISMGLKFIPYLLIWILFSFLYMVVPNTRVSFRSGILAGVLAGTCYQLLQWSYLHFQFGVTRYNAIYGSFAALPLFLIWLELSWFIVLLGAEFSFANQNVDTYEFEHDCDNVSPYFRHLVSLQITHLLIKDFAHSDKPRTADEIAHMLSLPVRLVRQLLTELVHAEILDDKLPEDGKELEYHPAASIDHFSIQCVLDALDRKGEDNIPLQETRNLSEITASLEEFKHLISTSPSNRLLKDI